MSAKFCAHYHKQFKRGEAGETDFAALRGEVFSNIEEFQSQYHGGVTIEQLKPKVQSGKVTGFLLCGTWQEPQREPAAGMEAIQELTAEEYIYFVLEEAISNNELHHMGTAEFVKVTMEAAAEPSEIIREMVLQAMNEE